MRSIKFGCSAFTGVLLFAPAFAQNSSPAIVAAHGPVFQFSTIAQRKPGTLGACPLDEFVA